MRDKASEELAERAAEALRNKFCPEDYKHPPDVGVILGTGWGQALSWEPQSVLRMEIGSLPGFDTAQLRPLAGHDRQVVFGRIDDRKVIALQGRIHLNEAPYDQNVARMVRLQVEMLLKFGVKILILTAAAGSLKPEILVGDIMVVDGFVSLFAPDMPLYAGEFVSPDDTLAPGLRDLAMASVNEVTGTAKMGGYTMLRGPFFEGRRYDKSFLIASGASTVGMSSLPEACVAALYHQEGVRVIALNFITNTASEAHSHEVNQRRALERSGDMGRVLGSIISKVGRPIADNPWVVYAQ